VIAELTPIQQRLADALEAVGPVIVRLPMIQLCYTTVRPSTSEHADRRRTLHDDLDRLAAADRLRLPRGEAGWDRSANPPLPRFVGISPRRPAASPTKRIPAQGVGWRPQLRWAAEVRDWSPRRFQDLLAINRWLGDAERAPVVPLRERSVGLFGDEKRLGELLSDPRLFAPERLTLELIRARRTSPPFISRTTDPSRDDALIVENWDTFDTLSGNWPAVGRVLYGAGAHVTAALPSLVGDPPGELRYFGDLDVAGLTIAIRASDQSITMGLPAVRPDLDLYRLLLEHGIPQKSDTAAPEPHLLQRLCSWLSDPDLVDAAFALLTERTRLAQEQIGVELLRDLSIG
jgi:Uncharacterized protein conserved in bacteria C-term(DUF2220)